MSEGTFIQETAPVVLSPIESRQAEVAQYQSNIAMYTAMANALPSEYPAHLEQYRSVTNRHEVIGSITDLDDVILLSDLWTYDDCIKAIRTETLEMRKAQSILAALETQES